MLDPDPESLGYASRGRENVSKRYLIHVYGFNLGVLMRELIGAGTPKGAVEGRNVLFIRVQTDDFATAIVIATVPDARSGELGVLIALMPAGPV